MLTPMGHPRGFGALGEECESGRIGTLGKRVWGNPPWVRIPPPPLDPALFGWPATSPSSLPDHHPPGEAFKRHAGSPRAHRTRCTTEPRLPKCRCRPPPGQPVRLARYLPPARFPITTLRWLNGLLLGEVLQVFSRIAGVDPLLSEPCEDHIHLPPQPLRRSDLDGDVLVCFEEAANGRKARFGHDAFVAPAIEVGSLGSLTSSA